jgi:hypothetical protein
MRARHAALVTALALLVVLSGCTFGYQSGDLPDVDLDGEETGTDADDSSEDGGEGGDDGDSADEPVHPPDPDGDVLGWEEGYWYNETLEITREDGLNETERQAVIARTMARIEELRGLEFEESVPVEVVSRAEFRNSSVARTGDVAEPFRRFDNAKFEAMFLVGEDRDALAVQEENRGTSVLGYYDPRNGTIVLIAEGGDATIQGEQTLAHELTHALQDQRFNLSAHQAATRDAYNAQNGLHEGDAHYVEQQYDARCSVEWDCLDERGSDGGGDEPAEFHLGIYILNYFPYSDGPVFVATQESAGGWDRVNGIYTDLPGSTEQIIYPEKYGEDEPTDVDLAEEAAAADWERVRPEPRRPNGVRSDYAVLGQSGMSTMFAYTLYDPHNEGDAVVRPREFLNQEGDQINRSDPFDYDLEYTSGWDGDRLHVYENDGETAYVWKSVWDSPEDAKTFAEGYAELLGHYGGNQVDDDTYRIDRGPYEDAFYIQLEGDTVLIVNAPSTADLGGVHADAG